MNLNKHRYLMVILVVLLLVLVTACQPGKAPAGTVAPAGQMITLVNPALQAKLEAGEALRIMPLGDAFVEGYCDRPSQCNWLYDLKTPMGGDGVEACSWAVNKDNPKIEGFRGFLRDKLTTEGVEITYVGSVEVIEGLAHEGHSGFTIDDMDYCEQNVGWLEQGQPDMILLLTGIDDAAWGEKPAEMLASLERLLGHIYEKLPATTEVIIAQYPPTRDEQYAGWKPDTTVNLQQILAEYNTGIPRVVEKLQADGKHVNYVNMENVFQAADEYNELGLMPRAVASERMAQAWLEQIMAILDRPVMVSASPTLQPPPTKQPSPPPTYYVDAPLRIMPLGDSITEGFCDQSSNCAYSDDIKFPRDWNSQEACISNTNVVNPESKGYREYLRDQLIEAGVNMTYVGSVQVVQNLAHEGHSGFTISDIDYCIEKAEWLDKSKPDIILLLIGTNDAGVIQRPKVMIENLEKLLTRIYQELPETTEVIVAQVIPTREGTHVDWDPSKPLINDILTEYNAGIPAVVEEFSALGKHVSLVDMREAVQSPDEYDEMGVHPNPVASERIAQVWFEKIMEIVEQED